MALKIKNEKGEWVIDQKAIQTSIIDAEGNFESDHVEGALRELSDRIKQGEGMEELEIKINAVTDKVGSVSSQVNTLNTKVNALEEDVEWLKENGGGGAGTVLPTIESDFVDCAIDRGTSISIPIFFTSPNMGEGTAYVLINNIQIFKQTVKQGDNLINIDGEYFITTENVITIYVKDRAELISNRLTWNVISGGIEISTTFDYEVDYGITDTIKIPYDIETGIEEDITLTFTIDGNSMTYSSVNGYNFISLKGSEIGFGVHAISLQATVGKYKSNLINFNIVIVSTNNLYLSSSFIDGSKFLYGTPVIVQYRLSKKSSEDFIVYLSIDGVIEKTRTVPVGSYSWTIEKMSKGNHKLTIRAVSKDGSEDISINLNVTIETGNYTPVEEVTMGLQCDLNAVGKSNEDSNIETWIDNSGNGHNGELINFNFGSNGFMNDTLVCDADAYVKIPWSPWKDNAIHGSTFDLIYTPINSGLEEARVIDYTTIIDEASTAEIKPFKGLFADILRTIPSSASSGSSAGKVNLDDENGEIHLTWVLDRENKFLKVYVNAVLSRIMYLTDSGSGVDKKYEDFSLDEYIYLNSTKGENCGTNNIKRFRVYDRALTSDEVLRNYLANITDLAEQERLYNFNYKNTTMPKMYLTGDTTNMTPEQTVPMKIEYVSSNEDKYGQSFFTGIQNNLVRIQGTSSLQYVLKNYTIYLKDEYGADMYYNPYGVGSKPSNVFCLKADYMESSHANNTGMARFINDCVYDTKLPMQSEDNNCRSTINGFPIELYINNEYIGVYNFNYDRYSNQAFGYDYTKYPNILVYEVNSNSNTSAGAFFKYGEDTVSSANITELNYYKRDFNLIYGNRTADADTYAEIKNLVEWASTAEQDLFRETISEHFNKEYLFRYYLVCLMIGAVDSLGKNMKLLTIDGRVFYPVFYDLDTCLGIDNSGYLTIETDVEIETGSYNTNNSKLWTKVWNFFNAEIKEEWAKMRQGSFTLDNLMKYLYDDQISVISQKQYNDDAQVKYLNFGSLYTYCCHGSKEHQIKRWLRERIAYVDSMMGYFTSTQDMVTIRMNKSGAVSFKVTPYIPLYFSVKWNNGDNGTQTFRIKRGQSQTFNFNSVSDTDQEVIIYHAQYIKKLDNLSNLNPSSCILSNARKLTNVEIHSTELYNINVENNIYLRNIDLSGCSALGTVTATGSSLNLSNCKYLKYVNVKGTALTEVQLNSDGGSLKEIYYPITIQSIQLINQRVLEVLGLPYVGGVAKSLYTVSIENCPRIYKFNDSSDESVYSSFKGMAYVNNLTLKNCLDIITTMNYTGFRNLQNITLINMSKLTNLGFDEMNLLTSTGTLKYVKVSGCDNLTEVTFNSNRTAYGAVFGENAILNLEENKSTISITGNECIKGLKTIILPTSLKNINFETKDSLHTSIVNLWSSMSCSVNTSSAIPTVTHFIDGFEGIDLKDINIENINLYSLINVPKAINFNIAPTTVNPNFNTCRDGVDYPFLIIEGNIDLSNYSSTYDYLFKGLDFESINLTMPTSITQTSFNHCFANTVNIQNILEGFLNKINLILGQYMFSGSDITDEELQLVLDKADIYDGDVSYCFSECKNINAPTLTIKPIIKVEGLFKSSSINDITNITINNAQIPSLFENCLNITTDILIPDGITNCTKTFYNCTGITHVHSNWETSLASSTIDCYYNCINITHVDNKECLGYYFIPTGWGGKGLGYDSSCIYKLTVPEDNYSLQLRFYNTNNATTRYMYIVDVNNNSLVKTMTFSGSTTGIYYTIPKAGDYYLLTTDIVGGSISDELSVIVKEIVHLCSDETITAYILKNFKYAEKINLTDCTINGVSLFESFTQLKEINFTNVTYINKSMLDCCNGCTSLTSVIGLNPLNCNNFESAFQNCTSLKEDIALTSNVTSTINMYYGCTGLKSVHANWIVCINASPRNCYFGCSGIQLINGEIGDLSNIPQSWGGKMLEDKDYDIVTVLISAENTTVTLGLEYTFNKTDWGDGTFNTLNSHVYKNPGTYTIKTGWNIFCNNIQPTNTDYSIKQYAITVEQVSDGKYTTFAHMFSWYWKLTKIDLSSYNNKLIKRYEYETGFDRPKGCSYMFYQTRELKSMSDIIGFENIDFKDNNINCSYMFSVSGITDFEFTDNLLAVSDTEADKYRSSTAQFSMEDMLNGTNIVTLDLSCLERIPKLYIYISGICKNCRSLESVNLTYLRARYYDGFISLYESFYSTAIKSLVIPEVDVSLVKEGITPSINMDSMCRSCGELETVDINCTNITSISSLYQSFYSCYKLSAINNLENYNITGSMYQCFYGCGALKNIIIKRITSTDYNALYNTCRNCSSLKSFSISEESKLTYSSSSTGLNLNEMFYNCSNITDIDLSKLTLYSSYTITFEKTFYNATSLNGVNLKMPIIGRCSKYISLSGTFANSGLTSVPSYIWEDENVKEVYFNNTFWDCNNMVRAEYDIYKLYEKAMFIDNIFSGTSLKYVSGYAYPTVRRKNSNTNISGYSGSIGFPTSTPLKEIGLIDFSNFYAQGNILAIPNTLTTVTFVENSISNNNKTQEDITVMANIVNNMTNLNKASLLSLLGALADISSSETTLSFPLSDNHKAKLTDEEIATAILKGWTI